MKIKVIEGNLHWKEKETKVRIRLRKILNRQRKTSSNYKQYGNEVLLEQYIWNNWFCKAIDSCNRAIRIDIYRPLRDDKLLLSFHAYDEEHIKIAEKIASEIQAYAKLEKLKPEVVIYKEF